MTTPTAAKLDSRQSWAIFAVGVLAYIVAVTQRTSFGVASVLATERFHAGASITALFVVVQLLVYAGAQVPVGVLTDRFGSRAIIATGAALMCLGQVDLAFAHDVVSALIARILVGAGDAMTFTPIMSLLPAWFGPRKLPIMAQLIGMTGMLGQILSAVPFAALLGIVGWTPAFLSLASLSVVASVCAAALLRNGPTGVVAAPRTAPEPIARQLAELVREPSLQLAFWIHWTCSFSGMTFALMWGYPFMVSGEGYPRETASLVMTIFALGGLPFAPLVGLLSRRAPLQRSNLAFFIAAAATLPWLVVLLWPGQVPVWLLIVLVLGLAVGGPGSAIGFDVARSAVPGRRMGAANAFVITAGFTAGLANVWLIGLVLDALGGPSREHFRWALATQFVFFAIGIVGIYTARRRARAIGRTEGLRYPPLVKVLRREFVRFVGSWRDALRHEERLVVRPPVDVHVPVDDDLDADHVDVVALLPGIGGRHLAVDVPPPDADAHWWQQRVDEYLALVASPSSHVGSIEVRCVSTAEADAARAAITASLGRRGATLRYEVTTL